MAQALCSQKTKLLEGLQRAIQLATEAVAEADGGAQFSTKKRAAAVECPTTEAQALHATHTDKPRSTHTGAVHKRRRLTQQESTGCDISAAGCWERGDERAEALEWQI